MNQLRKKNQQVLSLIFATLFLVLVFYFIRSLYKNQHQKSIQSRDKYQILGIESKVEDKGLPIQLKIPSINVDTTIEHVGITSTGEMGLPNKSENVGWFNLGPRPGEKGNAVIAGHLDGEKGEDAVFINLHKLKKGDKLYVENNKRASTTFVVREKRQYNPGYADEVFSSSDSAHLNLITCDGIWDKAKKSYSKRLVIFADRLP